MQFRNALISPMNNSRYLELIGNQNNPCLYAIDAINHARAKIIHYKYYGDSKNKIAKDLREFLNTLKRSPLNKSKTFMACFDDVDPVGRVEMAEFLLGILAVLREFDEKPWPARKTADIFDGKYEFHFNGKVVFPVLMCRNHNSKARRSLYTMVAFQPGSIFNYLKKIEPERYCTMRRSIHRRLDILFENNLPFYLSEKSSGKNIVQYLGFDPEELA